MDITSNIKIGGTVLVTYGGYALYRGICDAATSLVGAINNGRLFAVDYAVPYLQQVGHDFYNPTFSGVYLVANSSTPNGLLVLLNHTIVNGLPDVSYDGAMPGRLQVETTFSDGLVEHRLLAMSYVKWCDAVLDVAKENTPFGTTPEDATVHYSWSPDLPISSRYIGGSIDPHTGVVFSHVKQAVETLYVAPAAVSVAALAYKLLGFGYKFGGGGTWTGGDCPKPEPLLDNCLELTGYPLSGQCQDSCSSSVTSSSGISSFQSCDTGNYSSIHPSESYNSCPSSSESSFHPSGECGSLSGSSLSGSSVDACIAQYMRCVDAKLRGSQCPSQADQVIQLPVCQPPPCSSVSFDSSSSSAISCEQPPVCQPPVCQSPVNQPPPCVNFDASSSSASSSAISCGQNDPSVGQASSGQPAGQAASGCSEGQPANLSQASSGGCSAGQSASQDASSNCSAGSSQVPPDLGSQFQCSNESPGNSAPDNDAFCLSTCKRFKTWMESQGCSNVVCKEKSAPAPKRRRRCYKRQYRCRSDSDSDSDCVLVRRCKR